MVFHSVVAGELPVMGREVGEAGEGAFVELDVPFVGGPVAVGLPPLTLESVGAGDVGEGAGVGAIEEGLRLVIGSGKNLNGEGWAETAEGEGGVGEGWLFGIVFLEEGFGWVEGEAVGVIAVEGLGDADGFAAEAGGELVEGVGEFVGVAEGFLKEVVLAAGGFGDGGVEGEGDDGGGGGEAFEVGGEEAEKLFEFGGGFGDAEGGEVVLAVFVVEGEEEGVGDALVGLQAGGEGVEEVAEKEEEGVEAVERVVEVEVLAVVFGGTVEGEEAVVLAGGDVVEAGGLDAEALVEVGTGKGGEIGDGVEAPGGEGLGEVVLFGSGGNEGVEEKGEGGFVVIGAGEDVEVGEVGGGGEGVLEGEGGVGELGEVLFFPSEKDGVGGGEFEVGGEGAGEGEEFVTEENFVVGVGGEDLEFGATGECAGGGDAGVELVLVGGGVEDGEEGLLAGGGGFVGEGEGVIPELGFF